MSNQYKNDQSENQNNQFATYDQNQFDKEPSQSIQDIQQYDKPKNDIGMAAARTSADEQFLRQNRVDDTDFYKSPLATNFLRSTGLLDAYESTVASMISEGWPAETNVFDHAAYLLLRWQSENQDAITLQTAAFKRQFLMNNSGATQGRS